MARTIRARQLIVALLAFASDQRRVQRRRRYPNASDEGAEQTDAAAGDDGGDEPSGDGLLAEVRDRGTLHCGVNDAVPGFGVVDDNGDFTGFDIDFCKVIAAAVLGDAEAVEYVPLTAEQRFTSLAPARSMCSCATPPARRAATAPRAPRSPPRRSTTARG